MDSSRHIEPYKITKPIQLLAAWLVGLVLINGSFLFSAAQVEQPEWIRGSLIIASIVNVPLFLISIFLLQTKFRPEMQEDTFYSEYLQSKLSGNTGREINAESFTLLREDIVKLESVISEKLLDGINLTEIKKLQWTSVTVRLNKSLKNFAEIAKLLSAKGIPVHETFGAGAGAPENFSVAVGSGFEVEQIRNLADSLSQVPNAWISYAHDDPDENYITSYSKQVLIGAYGAYSHGILISDLLPIISSPEASQDNIYKILGVNADY